MAVALIVGTDKGGMIVRAEDDRDDWQLGELIFRGWRVTAATRDSNGLFYVAVAGEVFGSAILTSEDLVSWTHLQSAPRYASKMPGNTLHNRGVSFDANEIEQSITAENPNGLYAWRHVDQIWKLHAQGDLIFAGVSEAGLFLSRDQGQSWEPVDGLNQHESQPDWEPGFGGLALHSILTDKNDADRLWIGISSAGVFRSDDGGRSWEKKNQGVLAGDGGLRQHLLCFFNDEVIHMNLGKTLEPGDRISLVHSISGG